MNHFLRHLRNLDWILLTSTLGLVGIGSISLYSSSMARGDFTNLEKQLVFFALGFVFMIVVSMFDYRLIRNDSYLILLLYFIGVAALAGLLIFAPDIRGIHGWYKIGGISIDPIEYMKLVLLILMSKYLAFRHIEVYRIRYIIYTGIYFALPIALIALQPDLGPVLVLGCLWMILLLVAGIRIWHFLAIVFAGVATFALGWSFFLLPHQKDRIVSFISPELDPLGIGWSQLQAKIAIGNGGIWGQGFGHGSQTQYGFLSEPHTDFIFSAIAEEFGIIGVLAIFILFFILVSRILKIGLSNGGNFAKLFATGIASLIILQTLVNVGMNLGLLPIIGLPLPFVSYGGSSLILTYIGLGYLLSIKTH